MNNHKHKKNKRHLSGLESLLHQLLHGLRALQSSDVATQERSSTHHCLAMHEKALVQVQKLIKLDLYKALSTGKTYCSQTAAEVGVGRLELIIDISFKHGTAHE
jgi:hypothetical protein